MELTHEFLINDREYSSYDDFKKNCKLKTIPDFNFAYDIIDRYAKDAPEKRALVWIDDNNEEKTFTFKDISLDSKRAAYQLTTKGIKKGDTVMLVLRRRYEWWILMPEFPRQTGEAVTHKTDSMLLYFTSGTSGYPKMLLQDFDYPLGHIMTAKYWHGVIDDGLHLPIAETGWAKSTWGKLYGQ